MWYIGSHHFFPPFLGTNQPNNCCGMQQIVAQINLSDFAYSMVNILSRIFRTIERIFCVTLSHGP